MMPRQLGSDATLHVNATNAAATTGWNEVPQINDVTRNDERTTGETGGRGVDVKQFSVGQRTFGIDFDMVDDEDDTAWGILNTAYTTKAPIGVGVLDGPAESGSGELCDMLVSQFTRNEPKDSEVTRSVVLVAAGQPTRTTSGLPTT